MSAMKTVKLAGKQIGDIGYGLMRESILPVSTTTATNTRAGFTWHDKPKPYPDAIAAMRKALDSGSNFWNGGNFYGPPDASSLQLLAAYFKQYPEDAQKVVISIKGGHTPTGVNGSPEFIKNDIQETIDRLGGTKSLDIYECARIDPKTPVEQTIGAIAEFVKAGKLGGISMSECGAESIRRGNSVHPISAVEVEFSLFSPDILTNGVGKTCGELGIPIIAYSPFSRGLLTGSVTSHDQLDPNRSAYPRMQPEALKENLKLVNEVQKLADKKGVTVGQMSLAWIKWHSERNGMPTIIPIPGGSTVKQVEENFKVVDLTDAEGEELDQVRKTVEVVGRRYPEGHAALEFR